MGELNEAIKASILRSFTAREVEVAEAGPAQWRWSPGVILFPEGICPWCKGNIRSNRIWKVQGRQLVGRWKVLAGGTVARDEKADHPHATGAHGGNICIGNADSATAALFLHMNPNDCYWGSNNQRAWYAWLVEVWDHACPRLGPPCVDHTNQRTCERWGCPVVWYRAVAGCDCGCFCHPSSGSCRCGHATCRCGQPPTQPTTGSATEESGAALTPEVDTRSQYCSVCDVSFDDAPRSECCADQCEGCHGVPGEEEADPICNDCAMESDPDTTHWCEHCERDVCTDCYPDHNCGL